MEPLPVKHFLCFSALTFPFSSSWPLPLTLPPFTAIGSSPFHSPFPPLGLSPLFLPFGPSLLPSFPPSSPSSPSLPLLLPLTLIQGTSNILIGVTGLNVKLISITSISENWICKGGNVIEYIIKFMIFV